MVCIFLVMGISRKRGLLRKGEFLRKWIGSHPSANNIQCLKVSHKPYAPYSPYLDIDQIEDYFSTWGGWELLIENNIASYAWDLMTSQGQLSRSLLGRKDGSKIFLFSYFCLVSIIQIIIKKKRGVFYWKHFMTNW